jgi:hypothetical protein
MTKSLTNLAATLQPPVFPRTLHQLRPDHYLVMTNHKSKKRDNIFSTSHDLREERGTREMKTSHNDQTFYAR